jgi:hypothetical protein
VAACTIPPGPGNVSGGRSITCMGAQGRGGHHRHASVVRLPGVIRHTLGPVPGGGRPARLQAPRRSRDPATRPADSAAGRVAGGNIASSILEHDGQSRD